jgi:hypothetical protein
MIRFSTIRDMSPILAQSCERPLLPGQGLPWPDAGWAAARLRLEHPFHKRAEGTVLGRREIGVQNELSGGGVNGGDVLGGPVGLDRNENVHSRCQSRFFGDWSGWEIGKAWRENDCCTHSALDERAGRREIESLPWLRFVSFSRL